MVNNLRREILLFLCMVLLLIFLSISKERFTDLESDAKELNEHTKQTYENKKVFQKINDHIRHASSTE